MNENDVVDPMTVGPDTFVRDNETDNPEIIINWTSDWIARSSAVGVQAADRMISITKAPTTPTTQLIIHTRYGIIKFPPQPNIELKSPEERMIKQRVIPISVNGIKNEQSTIKR